MLDPSIEVAREGRPVSAVIDRAGRAARAGSRSEVGKLELHDAPHFGRRYRICGQIDQPFRNGALRDTLNGGELRARLNGTSPGSAHEGIDHRRQRELRPGSRRELDESRGAFAL